ncbi:unnamed protein product [Coregonus sp. 'balchen']|nr:unnamed protein product [Coregonus sp. 'balchen']
MLLLLKREKEKRERVEIERKEREERERQRERERASQRESRERERLQQQPTWSSSLSGGERASSNPPGSRMSGLRGKLQRVQWRSGWHSFTSRVLRTKPVESMLDSGTGGTSSHGTKLARVLSTVDLVSLGVGSCVGTGMYVVSGLVAKEMAGPGVIVSFIIAAVASILSGVCYAEFGVRVPKTTGSAYTYSYVTVGECVAFFIGWNLILEYLIGTAAGASALSSMADSLANKSISTFMTTHIGTLNGLGKGEQSYPDLLALLIAVIVTVIVALGVKNSVGFNNVLNVINLMVWVFMMVAGLFFVNGHNWDDGRFLPFGWSGVSVILTLMVPYTEIDADAPLMEMFAVHGCFFAKYIVAVGSVAGLSVSVCVLLLRYQPESDIHGFVNFLSEEQSNKKKEGVLAECEKEVCSPISEVDDYGGPQTNTCGAKNLPSLGDNEMLIGKPDKTTYTASHPNYGTVDMGSGIESEESEGGMSWRLKKLIGPRYYTMRIRLGLPGKMDRPTPATGKTVTVCVLLLFLAVFIFNSFIIFENPKRLPYMAPAVPWVPAAAMLVNSYLMLKLSAITWIRFAVWEQEVHASTYQRYDGHHAGVDDGFSGFSVDDDLYPPSNNDPWAPPGGVDGSGQVPPKADDDDWTDPKGGANRALAEEDPMDF